MLRTNKLLVVILLDEVIDPPKIPFEKTYKLDVILDKESNKLPNCPLEETNKLLEQVKDPLKIPFYNTYKLDVILD